MPDQVTQTVDERSSNLGGSTSVNLEQISTGMTDQEYLELANHCKSIVDSAQSHTEILKRENLELKKIIITSYGFIRVLDDIFDLEIPPEASYVLESIRSYLSQYIENNILS